MKRILILLGMAFCMAQGHAQTHKKSLHALFDKFREEMHEEFKGFRRQCMDDFIEFARNPWKEFEESEPVPHPEDEEIPPVPIPEEDKQQPIEDKPVVIEEVVVPEPVEPQPRPVEPIEEVPVQEEKYVDFTFFGTQGRVRFDLGGKVRARGVDENNVADALTSISDESFDNMIFDCLKLRDSLQLSDWAYLQMLKALSEEIAGICTNDAVLLMAYLYMQSGYKMRLASDDTKLYMLYASKHIIYDQSPYFVDGTRYYGVEQLPPKLSICQAAFPKERELSLEIRTDQQFAKDASQEIERSSATHPDVSCSVRLNKNLIDFYNTYPTSEYGGNFMTRWAMYANTPLCQDVKDQLYPALKEHIRGKSAKEAVGILLDFVQMAFPYGYDDEEWGYDRAFFAEETLFYPNSDCEDHAILFSRLVRDLIGLDVVLVYYPGHLATAVHFPETIPGDYLELDGKRFVICDPTYLEAPIGRTMSGMDNKQAKVILLDREN